MALFLPSSHTIFTLQSRLAEKGVCCRETKIDDSWLAEKFKEMICISQTEYNYTTLIAVGKCEMRIKSDDDTQ